ncbi:MAG: tandem-95 repeat protein [Rhodospirillaceae bacterium]|nr:tandem-95 repeat protein [Rhodospirillaceae bacterium]
MLVVTPTGGSNMTVTVAADAATDGLNTGPASAVSATATWDATALTVTIGGVPAKINSVAALNVTFTFSEDVTGFVTGDVNVTGGTKGAFTGTGTTYMLVVTPTGGSNVTVTVAADAATDGISTGPTSAVAATAIWDDTAPTVTIGGLPAEINTVAALTATFTFSEAVTGFVTGDVNVTGGTKGAFTGTGTTYMLVVTPTGGSNMTVTVAADAATDGLNTGPASAVSATATWEAIVPSVSFASLVSSAGEDAGTRNVTVNLSPIPTAAITVNYTVSGTAMVGSDFSISGLGTLPVASGATMAAIRVEITDDMVDENDETVVLTFTTGPGYTVGSRNSHTLTITDDDDAIPMVSLSAAPNPVDEGDSVKVMARLSEAISQSVTVPLVLMAGTAEPEDYGSLASIIIPGGQTTGTGMVTTAQDSDRDDETFTVALGPLPEGLVEGSPSSVKVTIDDLTAPPNRSPTVSASCAPCVVRPGGQVDLAAMASDPDGDPLVYYWSAAKGSFAGTADQAVAVWMAPVEIGKIEIRVEVSDGRGGRESAAVEVEVVNSAPAFEQSPYIFMLPEGVDGRERPADLDRVAALDPDGDELTYEILSGDRQRFTVGARDGMVRYVGAGEDFETEPNQFALVVRASDGFRGEAKVEVAIKVTDLNEAPGAVDDEAVTPEDQVVTVDVLANDSDPDGDRLQVRSVTEAANGAVRLVSGDRVTYTPEADFHGADSFTYVASDGRGLTDTARVTVMVLPINDAPQAIGRIADQTLDEGGDPVQVELSPYFGDRDGDALTYSARSGDTGVVVAAVAVAVLTLTPVVYGSAMVTITATDPAGLTATQSVRVGVSDRPQRAILENVLAATARGHLASLRAALGRRMQANPCEASPLEGMGRAESLGRTEAGSMLKGLGARAGSAMGAVLHVGEEALDPFGALQAQRRVPTKSGANAALETTDLMEAALRSVPGRALGIKGRAEFLIGWGGPQYDGWRCPGHGRWSLWGQGDIQEFKGIPSVDSDYDGDLSTGYAGLDMRLGARWLAGVAVSRSKGIGNWRTGTSEGRYTQLMTAVHPYLRWDGPSTSILASAGEGKGNARNARAAGSTGTSPTNLRLGLVELKQRLNVPGQLDFAFLGDAAWAWLRTGDGEETIDGQDIAVNQVRIGLDLSLPARFGSLELTPSGTVHARRDGGAGQTGSGIEVAGRLRAARGIVRLDAQVRMLAHHTAEGYRERGAAVTFALGRQGGEEGFSLSVSPRWGGSARSSGALLHGPLGDGFRDRGSNLEHWTLDALAGYGFILPGGLKLDLQGGYGGAIDGLGLQLRVAAANDEMARRLLRPH